MSLYEQQNFLARLYTDAEFRRAFLSAPEKIGAENDLSATEIAEFSGVLPDELNFFSESLFWKRLRETEKILTLTKRFLGEDFTVQFRGFSQNFNPQAIKKHLEDAINFCEFLQKKEVSEIVRNIAKFEKTKLEFFGYGRHFAVCFLDYNLKEILNSQSPFRRKKTIAVWLRIGRKITHFSI